MHGARRVGKEIGALNEGLDGVDDAHTTGVAILLIPYVLVLALIGKLGAKYSGGPLLNPRDYNLYGFVIPG